MNAVPSPIYPSSGISQLAISVFQDNVSRGVVGVRDQAILFKRWIDSLCYKAETNTPL